MHVALPKPTEEDFKRIANDYFDRWNYPNCVGAIDGKHVRIKCPANSGSIYFNYKEYFSVVLLAIVDANCKFIAIDVGSYGREGDAGIFSKTAFGKQIKDGTFGVPPPAKLPNSNTEVPHVIVGDEAFPLLPNLMKSYPRNQSAADESKLVYNYRHSRGRRTTENTFGIMSAYFRVFFSPIAVKPERVDNIIGAACILHNLLRDSRLPAPMESPGDNNLPLPEQNFMPLEATLGRNNAVASTVRDQFKEYFTGSGALSWQRDHIMQNY